MLTTDRLILWQDVSEVVIKHARYVVGPNGAEGQLAEREIVLPVQDYDSATGTLTFKITAEALLDLTNKLAGSSVRVLFKEAA